ncbi:MAG: hypothetical protein K8T90_18795 [Planctomycetes bacterium]|nr:hypothetical protein [Planctomycetota bacterium]
MRISIASCLAVVLVSLAAVARVAFGGSETPPVGPPWVRDFAVAQKSAIERGVPVFVYLTKTH